MLHLHTKCREIGTSKGIIIPSNILKYAHIDVDDTLDIEYSESQNSIIITKSTPNTLRAGWADAFESLHINDGDILLIPDVFEDEQFDETI